VVIIFDSENPNWKVQPTKKEGRVWGGMVSGRILYIKTVRGRRSFFPKLITPY
jgi:hypothetical protein